MRCYVEFVSVPTADTPGTLLLLHFDDRRYLIGQLAEGSSRACAERAIGLRKVSDILLTGKTEWANVGGLLGMILGLADTKSAARAATQAADLASSQLGGPAASSKQARAADVENPHLNLFGAPNLNHLFATSRRFIFRTGMPLNVTELADGKAIGTAVEDIEPTWRDSRILVWAMPVLPSLSVSSHKNESSYQSPRKRVWDETTESASLPLGFDRSSPNDDADKLRQSIVKQMFDSSWRFDRLVPLQLSNIQAPTVCYIRDPETNKLTRYHGPMPGGNKPVPDITVLAREPWPGAATAHIPPTQPAPEALSYIIRNYPQRGKFMPQRARELGVPEGLNWSRLANGETVETPNGDQIKPEMVLRPGKQGGGLAVIDLPSDDYVEPLLQRPEWQSDKVMDGVEAMIWILGPGVINNGRLRQFQLDRPHVKHIVSSQDCCPNVLALERAATNAIRHNLVDDEIFPTLEWDGDIIEEPHARTARPGQVITLEPKVDFEDNRVSPPFSPNAIRRQLLENIRASETVSSALVSADGALRSTKSLHQRFGDIEIVVLGTGSSHPSTYRNVSGTLVRVPGWGSCLFDCGEGTLNTLRRMFPASELHSILVDLKMIWISHMHADHHLGLTSVIKAWNNATRGAHTQQKLAIVSASPMLYWLHEYSSVESLEISRILPLATSAANENANSDREFKFSEKQETTLSFVNPRNTSVGETRSTSDIIDELGVASLNTVYVNHCRGAQAVSVVFKSGFKISYSGDCRPSADFTIIGRGSDVLIHEATLEDDMRTEAIAKKHCTPGEALIVASEMQAKICLLTHFSQRYPTMPPLGVKVGNKPSGIQVQHLGGVLEENGDAQLEGDIPVHEHLEDAATLAKQLVSSQKAGHLELIDENDVKRLIEKTNLKVLFAFDYMRLKLKDVPRFELKQNVLRQIYSLEVGKDIMESPDGDREMKAMGESKAAVREKKKQEKRDKIKAENINKSARHSNSGKEPGLADSVQSSHDKTTTAQSG